MKSAATFRKTSIRGMPFVLLVFIIAAAAAGCSGSSGGNASAPKSMKGYELYSWNDGGTWHYALMVGTNRQKTPEEVKAAGIAGTGSLEKSLGGLAKGEEAIWTTRLVPGMSLPSGEIQQQIKDFCASRGLKLTVD